MFFLEVQVLPITIEYNCFWQIMLKPAQNCSKKMIGELCHQVKVHMTGFLFVRKNLHNILISICSRAIFDVPKREISLPLGYKTARLKIDWE